MSNAADFSKAVAALKDTLLPGVPTDEVIARYWRAKGDEIVSGKFTSPESSAALAANTFGFFFHRPAEMPPLPRWSGDWKPVRVEPEEEMRFPWGGGTHPWLDAVIETGSHLIGVESKRYEPFRKRTIDDKPPFADAYERDVWGGNMGPYVRLRDGLAKNRTLFLRLDAVQLVKHAFGIRTQADKKSKIPLLAYVYAEPKAWPPPAGKSISDSERSGHAEEVRRFACMVDGAEVQFTSFTYAELLATFDGAASQDVHDHAGRLRERFDVG